jgi:hypothetical protein
MFKDLGELEHVFEQLENDSKITTEERLGWICDRKSEFNRRLTALMQEVNRREQSTGLEAGRSYQSAVLSELWLYLGECSKPSKLKAYLPKLKDLLSKAMVISLDHRADSLKQYANEKAKIAENWKKFDNNNPDKKRRGRDKLSLLLLDILRKSGRNISAKEVWEELRRLAESRDNELVYDVDPFCEDNNCYIYWGKDNKPTSFRRLSNRLSELKKEI